MVAETIVVKSRVYPIDLFKDYPIPLQITIGFLLSFFNLSSIVRIKGKAKSTPFAYTEEQILIIKETVAEPALKPTIP